MEHVTPDEAELVREAVSWAEIGAAPPWQDLGIVPNVHEDMVQAWIEQAMPGDRRPVHTHSYPWITVVLSGGLAISTDADTGEETERRLETGVVKYNPLASGKPFRHSMRNVGDTEIVMVGIQLCPPLATVTPSCG